MIVRHPFPVTEDEVRNMAKEAKNSIRHIYLHWTGGHYGCFYDNYQLCVDECGRVFTNCRSLKEFKDHTWMRNYNSIGIAMCCGAGASYQLPQKGLPQYAKGALLGSDCRGERYAFVDFGPEPPTYIQMESTARLVATVCEELCLPVDRETVQTHCEAAFLDSYGPGDGDEDTHWDLWFLPDLGRSGGLLSSGGDLLRLKAQYYQQLFEYERVVA